MATAAQTQALEEAPVAGPDYLLRVFPALLARNARVWVYFRTSLVMDLVNMTAQASIFFFVGRALGAGGQSWTANYAAFLAVGLVFNTMLEASLNGPFQSLSMNYWSARLETLLLSPCPIGALLIADSVWMYVRAVINALILAGIGWLFGARISASPHALVTALLALVLATMAILGFGLMSASMFLLINAKGFNEPVSWLIGVLQGLVAGAYFPIDELPGPLQTVARLLPQTYAIDAARRLLLPDTPTPTLTTFGRLTAVQMDLVILGLFVLILPPLGMALFRTGLIKARIDGGLSRWA